MSLWLTKQENIDEIAELLALSTVESANPAGFDQETREALRHMAEACDLRSLTRIDTSTETLSWQDNAERILSTL